MTESRYPGHGDPGTWTSSGRASTLSRYDISLVSAPASTPANHTSYLVLIRPEARLVITGHD